MPKPVPTERPARFEMCDPATTGARRIALENHSITITVSTASGALDGTSITSDLPVAFMLNGFLSESASSQAFFTGLASFSTAYGETRDDGRKTPL